jgi:hypothetical protein
MLMKVVMLCSRWLAGYEFLQVAQRFDLHIPVSAAHCFGAEFTQGVQVN